jgi:hypothetical protein
VSEFFGLECATTRRPPGRRAPHGARVLVLLALVVVGSRTADAGRARAVAWPGGTDTLAFENMEGIVMVRATATMPTGGDTSGTWVLDTGAGYLALDAELAERGGLAGEAPRVGESVGLASHALPRLTMGTLTRDQVSPVLTMRAGMVRDITDRPVLGLIGQQIVRDRTLWVDYGALRIALVPSGAGDDADDEGDGAEGVRARVARSRTGLGDALSSRAHPVPFTLAGDGKVLVTATVRDASPQHRSRPLTLIVDTGASKSVLFEHSLGQVVQGHAAWRSRGGLVAPTLLGPARARIARVPAMALDGPGADGKTRQAAQVENLDAVLADSPLQGQLEQVTGTAIHGLLGYSFLRHFRFGIDYPNRVLWLEPVSVGEDERPHEYSHVGMQLERRSGRVVVVAVATSSPAESAGIHTGDEVLAIDGWTIGSGALTEAAQRLEGRPGSTVTVRIRREGATRELRLKRERLL